MPTFNVWDPTKIFAAGTYRTRAFVPHFEFSRDEVFEGRGENQFIVDLDLQGCVPIITTCSALQVHTAATSEGIEPTSLVDPVGCIARADGEETIMFGLPSLLVDFTMLPLTAGDCPMVIPTMDPITTNTGHRVLLFQLDLGNELPNLVLIHAPIDDLSNTSNAQPSRFSTASDSSTISPFTLPGFGKAPVSAVCKT